MDTSLDSVKYMLHIRCKGQIVPYTILDIVDIKTVSASETTRNLRYLQNKMVDMKFANRKSLRY